MILCRGSILSTFSPAPVPRSKIWFDAIATDKQYEVCGMHSDSEWHCSPSVAEYKRFPFIWKCQQGCTELTPKICFHWICSIEQERGWTRCSFRSLCMDYVAWPNHPNPIIPYCWILRVYVFTSPDSQIPSRLIQNGIVSLVSLIDLHSDLSKMKSSLPEANL